MNKSKAFPTKYETISRPILTDAMALVVGRLISMHFEPSSEIDGLRLFPGQSQNHVETLEEWACRHLLHELSLKGYLKRYGGYSVNPNPDAFVMTQEAIDAYRAWYDQRGHMGEDSNALLP